MKLHSSLSQYIAAPKDYHLQMDGDDLKATKSTTSHTITSLNLNELKILATIDGLAKKVLAALRTNEPQTEFSVSGLLMTILPESIFSGIFGTIPSDMQENLNDWCEEKIGTPEYEARVIVSGKIKNCFLNASEVLDLSGSNITSLPESICKLSNMREFDLSHTDITALPESIGRLINLTGLYLSSTSIVTLPESLYDLSSLLTLNLSWTPITSLPESIDKLSSLRALKLFHTGITTLPASLGNLSNLINLDLSENSITTLPESIGRLTSLESLDLFRNPITVLPSSIDKLSNLRTLTLRATSITALPESIGNLFNLREFDLFHTPLAALPESIGNLSNLGTFNLSYTRITALPESIGNLSSLRQLDLHHNPIAALPASLARLSSSCSIAAEATRLSAATIAAFQTHLTAIRATNPELGPRIQFSILDDHPVSGETPLETKLTFWLDEFKKAFPAATYAKLWESRTESHYPGYAGAGAGSIENPYLSFYKDLLEHPQKELLNIFLRRLQATEDFKGAAKSTLILQVEQMLHLAAVNKSFRDKVFLILEDALSTCGDRVTNALTEIEIQYRLYSIGDNPVNLASLLIGIARKDLLHGIAVRKIKELKLGDAIETILYYKLQLKEVLKLPITTEGMLYPSMSGIKEEALVAAKDEVLAKTTSQEAIVKLLLQFDSWKERFKTLSKEELERFQETFMERLASIPSTLSEGAQLEATKALTIEYNEAVDSFVEARTKEWVSANLIALLGL